MGPHLKTPEDITAFPYFPSGTTSILSQTLTRDVWEQLKDKKDKKEKKQKKDKKDKK